MTSGNFQHPHIFLVGSSKSKEFIRPGGGGSETVVYPRNRRQHGQFLLRKLEEIDKKIPTHNLLRNKNGLTGDDGIYLLFESPDNYELPFSSLEYQRSGIELLAVNKISNKFAASVFVPDGKLKYFINKVESYLKKVTKKGEPQNKKLINSIEDIRISTLRSLWTDPDELFPKDKDSVWWEVWLRAGKNPNDIFEIFKYDAKKTGLQLNNGKVQFPDRTVLIAKGTAEQMRRSVELLNCIAELRKAKDTPEFFIQMSPSEQSEWGKDALSRVEPSPTDDVAICILDTGITKEHPLIDANLSMDDMHAFDKDWNLSDDHGHGTEMAGLALYGDLLNLLAETHSIQLTHCLESSKIISPSIQTEPALYGDITIQAISRAEITAPHRKRIFSMAVTYPDNHIDGQPSSWSSAIDQLCQGENGDNRLMIVSAGNVHPANLINYPQSNYEESVQDPAQSWNALCVGAYTQKMIINPEDYPSWEPVASIEDLSPYSTTSLKWQDQWPIKPDIVFEGGNCAYNPVTNDLDDNVDSLLLLTTYFKPTDKSFTTSNATSAATAQISRFAAMLQAEYLGFWPETIRALIVHSANWSSAMKSRFSEFSGRERIKKLLRCFGYGIPDISKALYSANHSLTLIAQDSLFPFKKENSQCKTRDMNLHKLPWPSDTLLALGELEVKMRVTLSYFIEPNPGRRGYRSKHSYASHGLRFDVKTAEESESEFNIRINKAARKEGMGAQSKSDSDKWDIGPIIRTRGSLHSDTWTGTAADLASKGCVAVYPVGGWWKERPVMDRWSNNVRYSLIVSIQTPETDIDIYTPIENIIKISIS